MAEMLRTFLALTPPGEWQEYFAATQSRLRSLLAAQLPGAGKHAIKWAAAENVHLTLLFLGDVEATNVPEITAAMERAASRSSVFSLSGGSIGMFPPRGTPRVLWLGLNASTALMSLHSHLAQELAARREVLCPQADARSFQAGQFAPHLTLARIRNLDPRSSRALRSSMDEFSLDPAPLWHVSELQLFQSQLTPQGSKYSVLSTARLVEPSPKL